MALSRLQGVNIMAFCKEYNAATAKMAGDVIPVEITVYEVSRPAAGQAVQQQGIPHVAAWAGRAMVTLQLLAAARPALGIATRLLLPASKLHSSQHCFRSLLSNAHAQHAVHMSCELSCASGLSVAEFHTHRPCCPPPNPAHWFNPHRTAASHLC